MEKKTRRNTVRHVISSGSLSFYFFFLKRLVDNFVKLVHFFRYPIYKGISASYWTSWCDSHASHIKLKMFYVKYEPEIRPHPLGDIERLIFISRNRGICHHVFGIPEVLNGYDWFCQRNRPITYSECFFELVPNRYIIS